MRMASFAVCMGFLLPLTLADKSDRPAALAIW